MKAPVGISLMTVWTELEPALWLRGAEALLKLRSLYASGDLEDYWQFHEQQEQERNHASRYAEKKLPQLQTPNEGATESRHLNLVK